MLNSERRMGFGYVLMNLSEWGMVNESRESKCSTILTIVVTVNSCSPFNTLHLSQPFKSQSFISHYHSPIITIYRSSEIGELWGEWRVVSGEWGKVSDSPLKNHRVMGNEKWNTIVCMRSLLKLPKPQNWSRR